jgi:signal transduction histidine kinase
MSNRYKIILLIFLGILPFTCFCQYKNIFSQQKYDKELRSTLKLGKSIDYKEQYVFFSELNKLESQILKTNNPYSIVDFYFKCTDFLLDTNINKSFYYANRGLFYSTKFKNFYFVGKFYEALGVFYSLNNEEDKSYKMILLSEKYLLRYAPLLERKDLYYNLCLTFYYKKDWSKVLKYGLLYETFFNFSKKDKSPIIMLSITEAFLYKNDLKNAYKYLKNIKINAIPIDDSYKRKKELYFYVYAKYLTKVGDFKNATKMLLKARYYAEIQNIENEKKSIKRNRNEITLQKISYKYDKIKNENLYEKQRSHYKNLIIILGTILIISLIIIIQILREKAKFKSITNSKLLKINKELEESIGVKSKFLNTVLHEFRTPLNAIKGTIYLLGNTDSEKIKIIENATNYLNNLTTQIFEYNFTNVNGLNLINNEQINLHLFIKNLVESFNSIYLNKNKVIINIDPLICKNVLFDGNKLMTIFNVFVDNAFKFTNNGIINIDLKLLELNQDCQKINVKISDNGIGISKEKIATVYDMFSQGSDEINLKYGGIGIGLALAEKIVKLYGSQIIIESELGSGTSVSFNLNFKNDILKDSAIVMNLKSVDVKNKIKVLVVEDNRINMLLITKILKNNGISYVTAWNGQEAVDFVKKEVFSIILMDIMMPIMDGFEAAFIISQLRKETPIVAVTAISEEINKEKFANSSFKKVINKPLNVDELIHVLDEYCSFK